MSKEYEEFLKAKVVMAERRGFEVDESDINPLLKPHQKAIVKWMIRMGRAACFAAFGLGKSVIQLEAVRLTRAQSDGMGLMVIPLGVRQEFMRDAHFLNTGEHPGITDDQRTELLAWQDGRQDRRYNLKFIRRIEEAEDPCGIYLTNYETIRDGKMDPRAFAVASLDEAAILRGFGGSKTFREFMGLFAGDYKRMDSRVRSDGVRYRYVATATPSPNEYIEILAYSAFLGVMDVSQAKTRFFKRDSTKADKLTIHPHKTNEFWMWVASWALFIQKPSDICGCSCHNEKNYQDRDSDDSLLRSGSPARFGMEHGDAGATAGASNSLDQATYCVELCSVADVSVPSMEERGREFTASGRGCSQDAQGPVIRTGMTTEGVESSFAIDGSTLEVSSPTWASHQTAQPSRESTTTGTTSQVIANGTPESNRPGIQDGASSLTLKDARNLLRPGQKNSASTTGDFTVDTNLAGQQNECFPACCDKCRCDEGYELPGMDVHWHEIPSDHDKAGADKRGQNQLIKNLASGVVEASREKRDSIPGRVAKLMDLLASAPDDHAILWHDLESERHAIERAVPDAVSIYGSQDLEQREKSIIDFSDGAFQRLAAKPSIAGAGCNFQRHCAWSIFMGIGFKFHDFIQAVHRTYRFLQVRRVRLDLIYTEAERPIRAELERRWEQHNTMVAKMTEIIKKYGLSHAEMAREMTRAIGVERIEVIGERYRIVNNDCVDETRRMEENSVGLILTSIPFSTQYEYSPNYADFGHTDTNGHFWEQMGFLIPELLRVLQPGRIAAIHVKDRIVPGGLNGQGFQTVYPFHVDAIQHFSKHGFAYMGMKTIVTDVVRENNQTYRLGWTEQCKDGSKMGVGMPEYLLLFRKPPTGNENSYADTPVVKEKPDCVGPDGCAMPWVKGGKEIIGTGYSRSRWQIDAHGYTRDGGNRMITPEELAGLNHQQIFRLFRDNSLQSIYDFEQHVRIGETLDAQGKLPVTFMLLQPQSWSEEVWTDVTRMLTLNSTQYAKGKEMHLCPMQFDIADRVINQFSMKDEVVYDPFGGLMTVPYRAILAGRKGLAAELSPAYFVDGAAYCKAAEDKVMMPSLFDLLEVEAEECILEVE